MKQLQFFEAQPLSGKEPTNLVIFLHGYGSNGRDLLGLSLEFAKILPDAQFVSPNAPFDFEAPIDYGYQWFSMINTDPNIIFPKIIEANNILDQFIESQLERFSLQYKDLILVGFSQGSMMSMYNSLRRKEEIAGVIAYSGKLILPTDLSESINSKPRICIIHGKNDMVVPFENMIHAESLLRKLNIPHEVHAIEGLEHTINFKGISIAKEFLEKI